MLPNLSLLEKIQQRIQNIPNRQGEYLRKVHYGCYLLCQKAGLRVSEAINFDLSAKTRKGLHRIEKPKGQKERLVYIPRQVINELKKYNWKPQQTNRFNFYHFLSKIKRELNLLANNDNEDDTDGILAGKVWLERPKNPPLESAAPVNLNLDELPELLAPNLLVSEPPPNHLSKIQHLEQQLSQIQSKKNELATEKETLENDLTELSKQNANLHQEKSQIATEKEQIQQDLTTAKQTIASLQEQLSQARENSAKQKQINNHLGQQLQAQRKINTDLANKIHAYEQNHINLQTAYQIALKDKETAQKNLNQLTSEIKNAVLLLSQWQKINYYQQLEQQNELKAQILQPPPWKTNK